MGTHRENIQGNGMKAVRLICVSCSERKIVHIPAARCITKEIYWQCLECQEAGVAVWGTSASDPQIFRRKRRGFDG
jgi:hypothetical protein